MNAPEGKRLCLVFLLVAMSACAYSGPPAPASPSSAPLSEREAVTAFLAKAFAGDFKGASEFVLLPPNASPDDFWRQRLGPFENFTRRQLSWLSSCTVGDSEEDARALAELTQRGDRRVQEVKRVELLCVPRPGLAAPITGTRVARINETWKTSGLAALSPGLAPIVSLRRGLFLNVSTVTSHSFNLSVLARGNFTVNLTDFEVGVDGRAVEGLQRLEGQDFSSGREVRIDLGTGTVHGGSHLRFRHLPSNTTTEYIVTPL